MYKSPFLNLDLFYGSFMPFPANEKYFFLFCSKSCFLLQAVLSHFSGVGNPTPVYVLHNSQSHHCRFTSRRKNFFIMMLELTSPVAALQIFTQILGRLRVFQNLGREYLIRVQSSLLFPLCVCFIFEGMLIFGEHEHNSMPENTDAEILTDLMRRLL